MTPLAHIFYEEAKLPGDVDSVIFEGSWANLIKLNLGVVIAKFSGDRLLGALGAVVWNDLCNGKLRSTEAFWFMHPSYRKHGVRLLFEYEKWCIQKGVHLIGMIHLAGRNADALAKLYQRRGYRKLETVWIKELPCQA